jgi:hypothetical protein
VETQNSYEKRGSIKDAPLQQSYVVKHANNWGGVVWAGQNNCPI